MAKNDLILLDTVVKAAAADYGKQFDLSEVFEFFTFEQILKNYDLSFEEVEFGWVDGKDDGGIDGAYLFLDQNLITEKPHLANIRNEPIIELYIITCKHKDTFKQEPITNLLSIIPEFLDLSKETEDLTATYNEELLKVRELFKETYIESVIKKPQLLIKYVYACRGDSSEIADNIESRRNFLIEQTEDMFGDSEVEFHFLGASELLQLYRTKKSFSLRLKFIENTISRAKTNYIALSKLNDFYNFITDENGKLRRYLFESNVRDYLGSGSVNSDIAKTLEKNDSVSNIDFWWLNNGVTIISTSATIAGKELAIENIQIVNGLQTTETIFKHFSQSDNVEDDRAVLIKVITVENEIVRDQIIRATNNQNPVDIASLRAMDKIQRDIEHILLDNDLYYDRRKNFYRNQGKPSTKIVSLFYLSSAIQAICMGELNKASRLKTSSFRQDDIYNEIFNTSWKIELFLKVVLIQRRMDSVLSQFEFANRKAPSQAERLFKHIFSYIFASEELKSIYYGPNEVIKVDPNKITVERVGEIWKFIRKCERDFSRKHGGNRDYIKKPHRSPAFHKFIKQKLSEGYIAVS
jgi:hypothetical protein